jgi:TonB family protein
MRSHHTWSATLLLVAGCATKPPTPRADASEPIYLNTREWKEAQYFNGIKRAVAVHWEPNAVLRSGEQSPTRPLRDVYIVIVEVHLDASGSLKRIAVLKSSGVDDLDGSAVEAFRRAAPFAAPPASLVKDGVVEFKFGFTASLNVSSQ